MREMALYHWIHILYKLSNRVYIDKHDLCVTLIFDVELLVNLDKQLGYTIICITNLLLHDIKRADEVLIFNNNVFVPEINANTKWLYEWIEYAYGRYIIEKTII